MRPAKYRINWMAAWRWSVLIVAWIGVVYGVLVLATAFWPPKAGKFSAVSLPRFEISVAKLPKGKELMVILDKRTGRDYMAVVSPGGIALTPLPWKDQ